MKDVTLWTAKATALVCSVAAAVYAAAELEPSPVIPLILFFCPVLTVILWLQKDARRTGVGAVHDWGYFLWLAWPVVIPWYAWKTRGRTGWALTLGLFGLILSAYLTSAIVPWLLYGVRYAIWYLQTGG